MDERELVRVAQIRRLARWGGARLIRERAGISLGELARAVRVSEPALSRWERAERSPSPELALRWLLVLEFNGKLIEDFGRFVPNEIEGRWSPKSGSIDIAGKKPGATDTLMARGAKQQILGFGYNWLIADDPVGEDDIVSDLERERTFDWFTRDVLSRKEPGAHVLVIGTRFHAFDLFGKLVSLKWSDDEEEEDREENLWEHIVFPALRDPATGFPSVEPNALPLWPERYSRKTLMRIRANNERTFQAFYQQDPASPEDLWFDEERLLDCRDPDRALGESPWDRNEQYVVRVVTWDPGQRNFGVAMLLDVNRENREVFNCAVLDIIRRKGLGPRDIFTLLQQWQDLYGPLNWFIPERNSYYWIERDEIAMWCRRNNIRMPDKPHWTGVNKHSTEMGVESLASDVGAGRIRLPYKEGDIETRHKTSTFIAEARLMPQSPSDDQVMALWLAKAHYQKMQMLRSSPRRAHSHWPSSPGRGSTWGRRAAGTFPG